MDLKRAWRNGFLVSVIFAIPLSDLYNNQFSNFVADNRAKDERVKHAEAETCGIDASCTGLTANIDSDLSGVPSSWDNSSDENRLAIPENTLADLLESGAESGDIQQIAIQFDPQDIFQSEQMRQFDLDTFGRHRENSYANFGSMYAPGFSGPFSPAMFATGGKKATGGFGSASGEDSESSFVDPLQDSQTQAETDTTTSGTGDESLHNVPEPSSFVLIAIGAISVATLLYRKSKTMPRLS